MRKLRLSCRKKENLKRWKVPEVSKRLRNHCFKQQKENQLVITEKNNEPNQKSTETVFNKNAKIVYSVMVKIA